MSIKDYRKGMRDAMRPFAEEQRRQSDNINNMGDELNQRIDDIIDVIELAFQGKTSEQVLEEIRTRKDRSVARYKIAIIYKGGADGELGDKIRKDLNSMKNDCVLLSHEDYVRNGAGVCDYIIFINNPDKLELADMETLYQAFGCLILRKENYVVVVYDPDINLSEKDRSRFVEYYENTLAKVIDDEKKAKAIDREIEKRKRRSRKAERTLTGDAWDLLPDALDAITLKLPRPIAAAALLLFAPVVLAGIVVSIPVGISEALVRATAEQLQKTAFDNKFIAVAQQQLLQVKINELFKCMQCGESLEVVKTCEAGRESNGKSQSRAKKKEIEPLVKSIEMSSNLRIEKEKDAGLREIEEFCPVFKDHFKELHLFAKAYLLIYAHRPLSHEVMGVLKVNDIDCYMLKCFSYNVGTQNPKIPINDGIPEGLGDADLIIAKKILRKPLSNEERSVWDGMVRECKAAIQKYESMKQYVDMLSNSSVEACSDIETAYKWIGLARASGYFVDMPEPTADELKYNSTTNK